MPENVHVRFGNDAVEARKPLQPQSAPIKATNSLSNGIKRLRDGIPKLEQNANYHKGPQSTSIAATPRERSKSTWSTANTTRRAPKYSSKTPHTSHAARKPFTSRQNAAQLEKARQALPIWSSCSQIRYLLRLNDVLLIHGETGSGKSTQVPQYLYKEPWCKRQKVAISVNGEKAEVSVGGMIAITQPRRVAAMTLAQRVAKEMGSRLKRGATTGEVGYSVRFESIIPTGTKIKFLTEGMLLQEMLHDPYLKRYSAVIVDEIHERSVDVDLITGFLRTLVHGDKAGRGGIPLKVVIMSATLDLGGIETFFGRSDHLPKYKPGHNHGKILLRHMPGYEYEKHQGDSRRISDESFSSWGGFSDNQPPVDDRSLVGIAVGKDSEASGSEMELPSDLEFSDDAEMPGRKKNGVAVTYVKGREYEVDLFYEVNPSPDYMHTMVERILQLHAKEPLPGDILAFLTGQDEIDSLQAELEKQADKLDKLLPKMKVMPLYGALSAQAQQDVFEKVKEPRTRKIVLATNIAETSVTVSGVRFVIDCGKSKVKQYRARLGMESLLAKPISRVSAIQRMGRAGREAKGKCYRLYTESDYLKLDQDELPEILRCDVVEAVLKMKARGVDDIFAFPLMDSPSIAAMEKALIQLSMMGALDDAGKLTETGRRMAQYPLPAAYGRVLVAAAEASSSVLLDIIDVISCLTADSDIFLQPKPEQDQEAIEDARSDCQGPQGITGRGGDIVTVLTTMQRYASEVTDRGEWCRKRLVSTRAMKMAMQIRKQLRQLCVQQKMLDNQPSPDPTPFEPVDPERAEALLRAFLKAFATKTALLGPDGNYVTTLGRNSITIHPSSVLYGGKKFEAIMFLDHVFTAKSYAKKVSPVQANWVEDAYNS